MKKILLATAICFLFLVGCAKEKSPCFDKKYIEAASTQISSRFATLLQNELASQISIVNFRDITVVNNGYSDGVFQISESGGTYQCGGLKLKIETEVPQIGMSSTINDEFVFFLFPMANGYKIDLRGDTDQKLKSAFLSNWGKTASTIQGKQ